MKKLLVLVASGLFMVCFACSASFNNEQACKNWKANVAKCGTIDITASVNCEIYRNTTTCDISAYFDCLTSNYKCNNGVPDTSGWPSCSAKAKCS